jgi:hypothetical protein
MHKIKLVNKERFEAFLSIVGITALLLIVAIVPRPKSPIEKWHDAIEEGQTWAEYVGGEINVD